MREGVERDVQYGGEFIKEQNRILTETGILRFSEKNWKLLWFREVIKKIIYLKTERPDWMTLQNPFNKIILQVFDNLLI